MKYLLTLFSILLAFGVQAQKISGTVLDKKGNPVPFTTIGIAGKNIGTYSFEDGTFTIDISAAAPDDCIVFRHIGFVERCIKPSDLTDKIILETDAVQLADVVVKPGKRQRAGRRTEGEYSRIQIRTPFNGAEMASLIDVGPDSVLVEELTINVVTEDIKSKSGVRVRAKFYQKDENGLPGKLIDNIEVEGKLDVKYNHSVLKVERPFLIANEVFVSFEWLITKAEADLILGIDYSRVDAFARLQEKYPGEAIDVLNNEVLLVKNPNGDVIAREGLIASERAQILRIQKNTPKFLFVLKKNREPTYYRSHSLGDWYRIDGSLIASIVYLPY